MSSFLADDDELDELVAQAIDVLETEGEPGFARLCSRHGDRADALRARVELLRGVGLLEGVGGEQPERLGGFRLVRALGAGGMGIVYLAVQEDLGREVALKIIRPECLYFPGARERFRREVEIVARLQHPGIVPIYTVGEADGVPYFAMELLRGANLEALLARQRTRDLANASGRDLAPNPDEPGYLFEGSWESACLRVIRQIADAVEHAHRRDVIHRDIKPSNILVTEGGASRAVLLDFGLAAAAFSGKITRSGTRLGSIFYMAPEQVRGDVGAVGPRSDVYSLGATLYEMLTLHPAYSGRSDTEVALAIERGTPKSIRELNPSISWEAETVCLAAMELDPARRYASAADFARDLDNVLARRPIEARRVGTMRRLNRWVARNPAKAAAVALSVVLLVGTPSLYAWQQRNASIAIAEQRDRAERNFERALAAVDKMLSRLGSIDLRFQPNMEPIRRAVLEDAIALLQEFVRDESGNERAERAIAKAHAHLGALFYDLGRNVEGAEAFERTAALFDRLHAAQPKDANVLSELVDAQSRRADMLLGTGHAPEALELQAQIDGLVTNLAELVPGDVTPRRRAIENMRRRAGVLAALQRNDEALATYQDAARAADELLATNARDIVQLLAFDCWNELGLELIQSHTHEGERNPEAVAALERAIELGVRIVANDDADPRRATGLAVARNNLAGALRRAGDSAGAMELYEAARDTLEQVVARFPETLRSKLELATVFNQIGLLHDYAHDMPKAEPAYRRGVELLRELVTAAPHDAALWNRFGQAQVNLATPIAQQGDLPGAMKLVASAIEAQVQAIALAPDDAEFKGDYLMHCGTLGVMRIESGDFAGAADINEQPTRTYSEYPRAWWNAAFRLAQITGRVRALPDLADAERERQIAEFSARSIVNLRAAYARGVKHPDDLHQLRDLKALHGTEAFEQFAAEVLAAKK